MPALAQRPPGLASARFVNVILGAGLFASAFVWPHAAAQRTNTWVVGLLCSTFALVAMAVPWAQHLNTLLAIWLFVSTWALPALDVRTVWTNVLVAIAMFVASLVPWDRRVTDKEERGAGSRIASGGRSASARSSPG
jgi:hypothetical protein